MMLNVRLDGRTEAMLRRLALKRGETKSEVVREALQTLARAEAERDERPTAYDLMKDGIGIYDGKLRNRAENHSQVLKKMLREKYEREAADFEARMKKRGRSRPR
jgi:hypothetical protein